MTGLPKSDVLNWTVSSDTAMMSTVGNHETTTSLDDNTSANDSFSTASFLQTTVAEATGVPHSIWLTVILGFLAGMVVLVTILGNITVLLAFGLERTIRQPTNYFLASLAVSDLLIGTFSMPLYTQYLLWGSWPLGPWLCDLWLSLDWTVCLTSQYTVFFITMDRFLSVKIPAKYRNWRTERRVIVMIAVTWVLPAIVFFTSIIGWQYFVGSRTVKETECEVQFMEDTMFTFLLTIGYYWITLIVMTSLYAGIYKVALDLQRKSDAKHKKLQTTMELAGDAPNNQGRLQGSADGSNNNSSIGDSQQPIQNNKAAKNSKNAGNNRKSVRAALPCPPGAQAVSTTSFSNKGDKDEDRSSSPAFASDDDNSSSGGAVGAGGKSPLSSGVYIGRPNPAGGIVNSALFANTGGLVRSLHGDLFFSPIDSPGSTNEQYPPPPPYSSVVGKPRTDTSTDAEEAQANDVDGMYTSASDPLEKQTTPLLQNEINKGCRFIDEKSFMAATLNSESAALLPVIARDSEVDDSDATDMHTSSPIWKRRTSLPQLGSDVFNIEDENSDCFIADEVNGNTDRMPPVASSQTTDNRRSHDGGRERQRSRADTLNSNVTSCGDDDDDDDDDYDEHEEEFNPAEQDGIEGVKFSVKPNNVAATAEGTGTANSSSQSPQHPRGTDSTNEDSSRSDTHCLSSARRRRNKDTRLHTFVKSVRSRNSRRRNRRERKSKSENRARKALRTISFILGAFVVCWTPYHICLFVIALCINCVNGSFYAFSYWLCYLNSPINPFCYAFANAQFKRTFLRIMKLDWHRT